MENPHLKWMIWGYHHLWKPHLWYFHVFTESKSWASYPLVSMTSVCATPRLSIKYVSKNVKYKCLHRYAMIQTSMFIVLIFRHFFCNVPCCNLSTCEVRRWATTRWNYSLDATDCTVWDKPRLMQNHWFDQYNWYQLRFMLSRFTFLDTTIGNTRASSNRPTMVVASSLTFLRILGAVFGKDRQCPKPRWRLVIDFGSRSAGADAERWRVVTSNITWCRKKKAKQRLEPPKP